MAPWSVNYANLNEGTSTAGRTGGEKYISVNVQESGLIRGEVELHELQMVCAVNSLMYWNSNPCSQAPSNLILVCVRLPGSGKFSDCTNWDLNGTEVGHDHRKPVSLFHSS